MILNMIRPPQSYVFIISYFNVSKIQLSCNKGHINFISDKNFKLLFCILFGINRGFSPLFCNCYYFITTNNKFIGKVSSNIIEFCRFNSPLVVSMFLSTSLLLWIIIKVRSSLDHNQIWIINGSSSKLDHQWIIIKDGSSMDHHQSLIISG